MIIRIWAEFLMNLLPGLLVLVALRQRWFACKCQKVTEQTQTEKLKEFGQQLLYEWAEFAVKLERKCREKNLEDRQQGKITANTCHEVTKVIDSWFCQSGMMFYHLTLLVNNSTGQSLLPSDWTFCHNFSYDLLVFFTNEEKTSELWQMRTQLLSKLETLRK